MFKQLLLIGIIVVYSQSAGLSLPVCLASTNVGVSAVTISAPVTTGTISGLAATTYTSTAGSTISWSSGTIGNTIQTTISGWPKNDTTVMEVFIDTTNNDDISNANVSGNAAGKVFVVSSSSTLGNFYIGFKASEASLNVTLTVGRAGNGGFTVTIYEYGWNDGTTCNKMCSKTLYKYNYLTLDIAGQYDCFGKNLIISGVLILLALLF